LSFYSTLDFETPEARALAGNFTTRINCIFRELEK